MAKQKQKLGQKWLCMACSSSIGNWKEKLFKRLKLEEYKFPRDIAKETIYFGAYHIFDWLKIFLHLGRKKVFFCGSDILAIRKSKIGQFLIKGGWQDSEFFCENEVELDLLREMGLYAKICPMIFDDPNKYHICYKPSENPRVFATYHKNREEEYGYFENPSLDWFCHLSEEEFNEKIKEYQGCIRLNKFDGFAESLAKSVLMGQYPITMHIKYPNIDFASNDQDLINLLKRLKDRKEPNYKAEKYWRNKLEESLFEILR